MALPRSSACGISKFGGVSPSELLRALRPAVATEIELLMTINRRRLFQSLALTVCYSQAGRGAEPEISLNVLRDVSKFYGTNLSDDRLRVVKPVLEQRLSQLRLIRDFEFDDTIAPTGGVLDK
jgi:hypothetical protein